ncbi:phosphoribosylformylglycinamidine cyclo-ligase [Candidatus Woesearchaeota archaeon]|nr:phosphoribosylformylglycinamidine cyclo-ligase [Candidatus Woesearchaeota archaeon]
MTTYKDAGVDIATKEKAIESIKEYSKSTFTEVSASSSTMFKFGGGIDISKLEEKDPMIILSTDGVGTKMMVAEMMNKWDTVGLDIVHHSVNDILTSGARPLFFLDYIASAKLDSVILVEIVKGISKACKALSIVMAGGETAEMPGVYEKGRYELVGTIGGVVDRGNIIDSSKIKEGDALIGLASNGLHTNGYSLARKILFEDNSHKPDDKLEELGETVGEALLKPHREYASIVLPLIKKRIVKGIAHITGGGFPSNIPRVIPKGLGVEIKEGWPVPPIFTLLQNLGKVPEDDMKKTFNMGIGMVLIVTKEDAKKAIEELKEGTIIGKVVKGEGVNYVGS